LSARTSGEITGAGGVCANAVEAKSNGINKNVRLMALPFYGRKMLSEVRYDLERGRGRVLARPVND